MIMRILERGTGGEGLLLLITLVFIPELLCCLVGGELGGFAWIAFHFVFSPLLCFLFVVGALARVILRVPFSLAVRLLSYSAFAGAIAYLLVTGNIKVWPTCEF